MADEQRLLEYAQLLLKGAREADIQIRVGLDEKRYILHELAGGSDINDALEKLRKLVDAECVLCVRLVRWLDNKEKSAAVRLLSENLAVATEAGVGKQVQQLVMLNATDEALLRSLFKNILEQKSVLQKPRDRAALIARLTGLVDEELQIKNSIGSCEKQAISIWGQIRAPFESMAATSHQSVRAFATMVQALSVREMLGLGLVGFVVPGGMVMVAAYMAKKRARR
jgi:hypothetical protein